MLYASDHFSIPKIRCNAAISMSDYKFMKDLTKLVWLKECPLCGIDLQEKRMILNLLK